MAIQENTAHAVRAMSEHESIAVRQAFLRLVSEQEAIAVDQLAELLNLDISDVVRLAYGLKQRVWVGTEELIANQYPWVWARAQGARHSGTGLEGGRPDPRDLPYLHAVNEARIFFAKNCPEGVWICRGTLLRDFRATRSSHPPAAVLEVPAEDGVIQRHAVEVGWLQGNSDSDPDPNSDVLEEVLAEQVAHYDAVEYFCGGRIHRFVEVSGLKERYESLTVRELKDQGRQQYKRDDPWLAKLAQQNPGARRGSAYPLRTHGKRQRVIFREPAVVYAMDLSAVAAEVPRAIAETEGTTQEPVITGAWERKSSGPRVYCIETNMGVYRVVRSGYGWRADEVISDGVFIKKAAQTRPKRRPLVPGKPKRVYPFEPSALPQPALRAIMEIAEITQPPRVSAAWRSDQGGARIYCIETEHGSYRVAHSGHGWRADEVVDDGVFEKRAAQTRPKRRRLNIPKSTAVREFDLAAMPVEVPRAIAEAEGSTQEPQVRAIWRKPGSGPQVYCAETAASGIYRVVRSARWGWRADRVSAEIFVKEAPPAPLDPWRFIEEPDRFEIDDPLWSTLKAIVPEPGGGRCHRGKVKFSNRAILSGLIYFLREELTDWRDLPPELGFGTQWSCPRRLRRWEKLGAWDQIREALEEGLPDGRDLNWSRLEPRRHR